MSKVFLGGTCGLSDWRNKLIPLLEIDYFNPVVENWTEECIKKEDEEKADKCNIHLYYIDSHMSGLYTIAEIIDSCYHSDKKTVFVLQSMGFSKRFLNSLQAVGKMASRLGAVVLRDQTIDQVAYYLNGLK